MHSGADSFLFFVCYNVYDREVLKMGLVEIEKKNVVKIDGMSTDEQVQHLGTLGDENLGSLNLAPTTLTPVLVPSSLT